MSRPSVSLAARLVLAPAAYGFAVGWIRSPRAALLNLVKLPLLVLISVAVAALAYTLVAKLLVRGVTPRSVASLVLGAYADLGVLLASLAPVCLFCALTFARPTSAAALGEYPLFLGLNVAAIALCGALSVLRQARELLARCAVSRRRAALVVGLWLGLSLLVGGQTAWWLRPFFGNAGVPDDGSFCLGSRPDFRGATSFYEALADLIVAP